MRTEFVCVEHDVSRQICGDYLSKVDEKKFVRFVLDIKKLCVEHELYAHKKKKLDVMRKVIVLPQFLLSDSEVTSFLLHTISMECPSHLHRNDGHSMEMRWRCDGDATEEHRKNFGRKTKKKGFS